MPIRFGPSGNYIVVNGKKVYQGNAFAENFTPSLWFNAPIEPDAYDWYRVPATRVLVGANASLRSSAAGLIFAQSGQTTQSALVFEATTPSTVTLTSRDLNTTGPNILYTAEADAIPRIAFTNGAQQIVTSISTNSGTNGAIISYNSADGAVVNILTYSVSRSTGKPSFESKGDRTFIRGVEFTAYGADGKELGRSSEVALDAEGKVELR